MEVYGNTSIDIEGGEPTLYPEIFELVSYCVRIGLHPTLITNGIVLDNRERCRRFQAAGVRDFKISIHGLGDVHDTLVGRKGSHQRQMRALRNLAECGIPFRFNVVPTPAAVPQLPDIARLAVATERVRQLARVQPHVKIRVGRLERYALIPTSRSERRSPRASTSSTRRASRPTSATSRTAWSKSVIANRSITFSSCSTTTANGTGAPGRGRRCRRNGRRLETPRSGDPVEPLVVVAAERLVPLGRRIPGAAEWLSIKRLVNHASIRPARAVQRPPPRAPISGSQESKAVAWRRGPGCTPESIVRASIRPAAVVATHGASAAGSISDYVDAHGPDEPRPIAAGGPIPIRRTTSGGSGNSWKRKTSRGR